MSASLIMLPAKSTYHRGEKFHLVTFDNDKSGPVDCILSIDSDPTLVTIDTDANGNGASGALTIPANATLGTQKIMVDGNGAACETLSFTVAEAPTSVTVTGTNLAVS